MTQTAVHLLFAYWTVLRKCQELLTVPGVREMFRRSFSGNLCATVCHECFQFGSSTTERLPVLEWFQDVPSSFSVCLEATRITWITRAPDITWPCDGLALTRWLVDPSLSSKTSRGRLWAAGRVVPRAKSRSFKSTARNDAPNGTLDKTLYLGWLHWLHFNCSLLWTINPYDRVYNPSRLGSAQEGV